LHKEQNFGLKV